MNLFGQVMEELGAHKQYEPLICEALMAMITFASQNFKFKNCFVQPIGVSTQSKKITILKLVTDKIQTFTNLQSTSKVLRLLYTLIRSLSLSPEVIKEVIKLKFIEDVTAIISPQCKNDKDIKLFKAYLTHYMGFLAAFTYSDEGCR